MAGRVSRKRGTGDRVAVPETTEWKTALEEYCDAVDSGETVPDEYLEAANLVAGSGGGEEPMEEAD